MTQHNTIVAKMTMTDLVTARERVPSGIIAFGMDLTGEIYTNLEIPAESLVQIDAAATSPEAVRLLTEQVLSR